MILAILTTLFLGGQTPTPLQRENLQQQLDALTKRGYTFRFLSNDLVEIKEPITGATRVKSLREPSEATIRSWAARRNIPILEIDPNTIDTSQYTGWFRYWATVPLSIWPPLPLVVGDVDKNNKAELYGIYRNQGIFRSNIYEVDSTGIVTLVHQFNPYRPIPVGLSDFDANALLEVNYISGDSLYTFEQADSHSLPVRQKFVFEKDELHGTATITQEFLGELDGDSLMDYLYRGSVQDSLGGHWMTGVAEYSYSTNSLHKVWSSDIFGTFGYSDAFLGGYSVGDFDCDGRKDFASSDLYGHVLVAEHTRNDSFAVAWRDSVPFVNVYYVGSGDVDGDGKAEFFVGATVGSGDWTTVFEADSDNHYSPKLLIHLLSGGTFDDIQYLTTDVDGDGKLELIICAGADIYMFKSDADNQYHLWYLKRENARDGIQFYDFNRDGRKDFVVSKSIYVDSTNFTRNSADIYIASGLTTVNRNSGNEVPKQITLYTNYPNPFNPTTTITFLLPSSSNVRLTIYDMLGREVDVVLDKVFEAGSHTTTWNAAGKSSGLYICRLQAGKETASMKLLLIR
jgi:hypothetical protein